MVQFQYKYKSKGRRRPMSQLKDRLREGILSYSALFVLFRPSTDWMRTTHIREHNLLYSVCGFEC